MHDVMLIIYRHSLSLSLGSSYAKESAKVAAATAPGDMRNEGSVYLCVRRNFHVDKRCCVLLLGRN